MEIFKASNQWATRPADQTFWGLKDAKEAASAHKASAVEFERPWSDLRVEAVDGNVALMGKAGVPAELTHYAFSQLAKNAQFPADPLRKLPATLACQVLNHQIKALIPGDKIAALMAHRNGSMVLRSVLTERYERYWNADLLELLDRRLTPDGWRTAPARPGPSRANDARIRAATETDVIDWGKVGNGLAIKVGDQIGPAGVYVSDHDMFTLLVRPDRTIEVPGATLHKFALLWNSEVGERALGGMTGYLDMVCGNHILWGARDVCEFSIRHVGEVESKFRQVALTMRQYADDSVSEDKARILSAQSKVLGASKDEVLETLLGINAKARLGLGQGVMEDAYDTAARTPRYGNPRSVWGIVNGLTEVSQGTGYTEDRVKIDRAAGKLMEVTF